MTLQNLVEKHDVLTAEISATETRCQAIRDRIVDIQAAHQRAGNVATRVGAAHEKTRLAHLLDGAPAPQPDDRARSSVDAASFDLSLLHRELVNTEKSFKQQQTKLLPIRSEIVAELETVYRRRFEDGLRELHDSALQHLGATIRLRQANEHGVVVQWPEQSAMVSEGYHRGMKGFAITTGDLCPGPADIDADAWFAEQLAQVRNA